MFRRVIFALLGIAHFGELRQLSEIPLGGPDTIFFE